MFRVSHISETFDLVVQYIKQETVEPLRGAGRWLGFGLVAAHAIILASLFLLLGVLRLLQSGWSWAPYLITAVVGILLVVWSLSRINKGSLNSGGARG
jgi:uncharacterized membrane protein